MGEAGNEKVTNKQDNLLMLKAVKMHGEPGRIMGLC